MSIYKKLNKKLTATLIVSFILVTLVGASMLDISRISYSRGFEQGQKTAKELNKTNGSNNDYVYTLDTTASPYFSLIKCDASKLHDIYTSQLVWGYSRTALDAVDLRKQLYDLYQKYCTWDDSEYYNPETNTMTKR